MKSAAKAKAKSSKGAPSMKSAVSVAVIKKEPESKDSKLLKKRPKDKDKEDLPKEEKPKTIPAAEQALENAKKDLFILDEKAVKQEEEINALVTQITEAKTAYKLKEKETKGCKMEDTQLRTSVQRWDEHVIELAGNIRGEGVELPLVKFFDSGKNDDVDMKNSQDEQLVDLDGNPVNSNSTVLPEEDSVRNGHFVTADFHDVGNESHKALLELTDKEKKDESKRLVARGVAGL